MRDKDIRFEIKNSILQKYYKDPKSRVVEELSVSYGDAIIDMAVINESLHGYEIKSEYDTLNRLPNQMTAYCKTFDFITIITGNKHLPHLLPLLPEWCGILIVTNKGGNEIIFTQYRKARKNNCTDKYSIAQLLWKDETIDILNECGISKGIKYKPKPVLWNLLSGSLNKKTLSEKVREKLKVRVNWKSE